jgi:hypothetical protein
MTETTRPAPTNHGMRRRVRLLVAFACAAVVALSAACGGDDGGTVADGTTSVPDVTTDEPDDDDDSRPPPSPPELDADPEPDDGESESAPAWEQVATDGESPPARSAAVLVAATDGTLWLHGGQVDGVATADLWRFDGERWESVETAGDGPAARFEHVGAWDPTGERLVIATGQDDDFAVFDDVWAFDPATGDWSLLAQGGPAPRYGSCAVIDGEGRLVVSHGFSLAERFGDTWAFDFATETWADVTPADGPAPVARCLHACAWDTDASQLVLFGGRTNEEAHVGDTWLLGAEGWQEIPGGGPLARVHSRAMFLGDGVHLLGGEDLDGLTADTWTLSDGAWVPGPTDAPTDRHSHAVAQHDGAAWIFGGEGPDGDLDDLWRVG